MVALAFETDGDMHSGIDPGTRRTAGMDTRDYPHFPVIAQGRRAYRAGNVEIGLEDGANALLVERELLPLPPVLSEYDHGYPLRLIFANAPRANANPTAHRPIGRWTVSPAGIGTAAATAHW